MLILVTSFIVGGCFHTCFDKINMKLNLFFRMIYCYPTTHLPQQMVAISLQMNSKVMTIEKRHHCKSRYLRNIMVLLSKTHTSDSPCLFGVVKVPHEHIGPSDTNFPLAISTEVLHFWDVCQLDSRASDWWTHMVRPRVSLDRQGAASRALGLTIPIETWTNVQLHGWPFLR